MDIMLYHQKNTTLNDWMSLSLLNEATYLLLVHHNLSSGWVLTLDQDPETLQLSMTRSFMEGDPVVVVRLRQAAGLLLDQLHQRLYISAHDDGLQMADFSEEQHQKHSHIRNSSVRKLLYRLMLKTWQLGLFSALSAIGFTLFYYHLFLNLPKFKNIINNKNIGFGCQELTILWIWGFS